MESPLDLILLDGVTGTGAGPAIGFAQEMRYGNKGSTPNQNQYPKKLKIRVHANDSATGAVFTVQYQDSPDGTTWTTQFTQTVTVAAVAPFTGGHSFLFTTKKRYVRLNVSAVAGGVAPVLNAYMSVPMGI